MSYERTEKQKHFLRTNRIGKKHTSESIEKNRKSHEGKKHTDETKDKLRLAMTGKILSDETKDKMRIAAKIRWQKYRDMKALENTKKEENKLNDDTNEKKSK